MDKVLSIIKNKWFRLGVSVISLGYVYFTGFMAWLVFAYHLEPTNSASLFALYLFINFLFGAEMVFTRKSIITKVCAAIIPFEVFIILIAGFGQWFVVIPPIVTCMVCFFASGLNETLKMVLGTIFLLMFVVGSLAYITLQNFGITLGYVATGEDLDMSQRQSQTLLSPDGSYRLVKYVKVNKDRTTTSYYIERADKDMHFWFLDCAYTFDTKKLLVTVYQSDLSPEWVSDTELLIDGKVRNIPELYEKKSDESSDEQTELTTKKQEA